MEFWLTAFLTLIGVFCGAILTWLIQRYSEYRILQQLRDAWKEKEHISLSEEFLLTRILAKIIKKDNFTPKFIFAVGPGGAMIAEWLSRRFLGTCDKPIPVLSVWVDTTRKKDSGLEVDEAKCNENIQTINEKLPKDAALLLVTDICRSGNTLQAATNFLNKHFKTECIRTATLLKRDGIPVHPNYVADTTSKMVLFDWKSKSI